MKLLVLIGTDYHLCQLPHFLRHYHRLGVDGFLCGLHGRRIAEARRILADYPVEIVAEYGDAGFRAVCAAFWKANLNLFRRQYVQPGEWCLYADVDEFHEYPADFFAALDPRVNAVMGTWVERLATPDGQLRACQPYGNLGEQFPFATREIFCGISHKVMATRGSLDVAFGYHYLFGDAQVFYRLLNVHHFRWDDQAAEKYRDRALGSNSELRSGRVPDLRGVYAVDPPFPAAHEEPGPEAAPGPVRRPARLAGEHPAVSCICLTYGRPEVLEEAIHSFLLQDYVGPKELIVLNDYDKQILELDHPEVLVVNLPKRLRTVGEKMNLAVSLAAHDLLFVWDDDDVYLPHRLTLSVAKLEARHGFFKPDKAWLWDNGTLHGPGKNLYHSGSCWMRRLFDEVGGYPAAGTGYDLVFEQRLKQKFPDTIAAYDIRPEDIYYIYRWNGTGSYHMSGYGAYEPGANVGHQQVETYVQRRAEQGGIQHGRIRLRPHWNDDYRGLVADCLRSQPESPAGPVNRP